MRPLSPSDTDARWVDVRCTLLVVPVFLDDDGDAQQPDPVLDELIRAYRASGLIGACGEDLRFARRDSDPFQAESLILVGVGTAAQVTTQHLRLIAQKVARSHPTIRSIATTLHQIVPDPIAGALAFIEGLGAGSYRFDRYRTRGTSDAHLESVQFLRSGDGVEVAGAVRRAAQVEDLVRWARDLVNVPGADLTPLALAERVTREAVEPRLRVRVIEGDALATGGFGGILGVGSGSHHPPCLIELTYTAVDYSSDQPLRVALIGKGITFDSGGLSLKKTAAMLEMKSDMAGGATMLAVVRALAALETPGIQVTALVPAAENMPGGGAVRPGDVITHRNGLTSEVADPDCEGRLVMADALALAAESRPDFILDAATLTYSCVAAVGTSITVALGNDADLMAKLRKVGDDVGEPVWELPLWQPYLPLIASPIADLRNEGSDDSAGCITSSLFLEHFVAGLPWVHLDIGGTGYVEEADDLNVVGGTGVMVRTLVRLLAQPDLHQSLTSTQVTLSPSKGARP